MEKGVRSDKSLRFVSVDRLNSKPRRGPAQDKSLERELEELKRGVTDRDWSGLLPTQDGTIPPRLL